MQAANRSDELVAGLEYLNSLLDPNTDIGPDEGDAQEEEPPGQSGRSKGGKSGKTDQSGVADMFTRAARSVFRRIHKAYAGVLGLINPSDGHPQQELVPDFGWFRPLSYNNATWVLYWPELEI
jgi:hypothetical protein